MNRRKALAVAVARGLTVPRAAPAADKPPAADQPERLTDAERRRLEKSGPAVVKKFVAALRERFSDEKAGELRKFINPSYLKEHGLSEGAFPIQRVVTGEIFDNQLSDDPRTALIVAKTEDAAKECFLFRLTVHDDAVYIIPLVSPDKQSKSFHPWLLRVKV